MKKRNIKLCLLFVMFLVLTALDQLSKYLASKYLIGNTIVIIEDVFELKYIENTGAAWGILSGQKTLFIILTTVVAAFLCLLVLRLNRFTGHKYVALQIVMTILISGAIGNLIDRIRNGYVVDYFYFKLIDFPVFNVADCYVTVSTAVLLVMMMFKFKENELDEIFTIKKRNEG